VRERNPLGTIPVIELNGRILTQSYAILRKFARNLKAYDGKTDEEMYWADAMCDIAIDCESAPTLSGHGEGHLLIFNAQGAQTSSTPSFPTIRTLTTPSTARPPASTSSRALTRSCSHTTCQIRDLSS